MNNKRILIISKNSAASSPVIKSVADFLVSRGCEIYCLSEKRRLFGDIPFSPVGGNGISAMDAAIAFGGDGTMLKAAKLLFGCDVPVLGINMGTVGYLTDTEPQEAESAVEKLLEGSYTVENRCALSVKCGDKNYIGVNEAVIYRGGMSHILTVNVKIDGQDTETLRSDGVIVATPTGSTAYNLSAGGPIVTPLSDTLVVTPICAHSLTARPIVIGGNSSVTLTVSNFRGAEHPSLDVDGKAVEKLNENSAITISVADKKVKFARTRPANFFKSLQSKLALNG
jgi:NAD+ kinase